MSNTKFLNLDEFQTPEEVTIRHNGVDHHMKEMSVADFIWAQKNLKNADKGSEEDQLGELVDVVHRQFPTFPKEEIMSLGLTKLRAITDFLTQIAVSGAQDTVKKAAERQGEASPAAAA